MAVAYIYPGQGSQYVGMAYEAYKQYKECSEIVNLAIDILGFDVKKIMFESCDLLNQTEYTQIALLIASKCMEKKLELEGHEFPQLVAGLSLGEYNALVMTGAICFEDALRLVKIRGKLMQNAVPTGKGSMAAVIKVPEKRIKEVCMSVSRLGGQCVQISNYNCPGQYVISGDCLAVEEACGILKSEARLIKKLNISVPSHCELMRSISDEFASEIAKININDLHIPYVSNVTGEIVRDKAKIPELLVKQLYSPVLWYQSVRTMIDSGINKFIEVGPGKVLTSYMKRISKDVQAIAVDD